MKTDANRTNFFSALRQWCGVTFAILSLAGCAGTERVLVPSDLVLKSYGTIGIIDFTSNADPSIERYATQLFQEDTQSAQPGVPILKLGTKQEVLSAIGANEINTQTISKIGEVYKVDAVFIGDLTYSDVRTDFDISQVLDLKATVKKIIHADLAIRLDLVKSGATVWSNSASFKRTFSKMQFSKDSIPTIKQDRDEYEARRKILPDMTYEITSGFRGRYIKQRIPK